MEQIILLAIQAIEALLPEIASATPTSVQKVINLLENAIPIAVQLGEALVAPIRNIIAQLEGSGAVTAAQVTDLNAQLDAAEQALDAAAAADGLG